MNKSGELCARIRWIAEVELFVVYPNEFWIGWLQNCILIRKNVKLYFYSHREIERLAWIVSCEPDYEGEFNDTMWNTDPCFG